MANIKSAIKAIRQSQSRSLRNQAALTELKTLGKGLAELGAQDPKKAEGLARLLASKWDRAVSRGIVPKQRANRKKTRIAHFLTKLSSSHG